MIVCVVDFGIDLDSSISSRIMRLFCEEVVGGVNNKGNKGVNEDELKFS
jgi:hypothetical protein